MNETTFETNKQENNEMPQPMTENVVVSNMETVTTEMQQNENIVAFQQPVEEVVEEAVEKPYTFRKFSAPDVFPMFKILGKIGINEFTKCFENDGIKGLIESFKNGDDEGMDSIVGMSVMLEAANVILGNLPKCEDDIYNILSRTSNLSVEDVKGLDLAIFTEMIIDFIQKDDFKDFFKVVSKQFK